MVFIKKCAVCGKAINEKYGPFCSKRCRDIDLGKWMNGSYSIPTGERLEVIKSDNIERELD